ncbi:caveolin-2 [Electrophorus electricus]|uniref:Caveolin n=1 Tax=Electrophorus electricus TaxID=8005 RepID=A0A4W4GL93_ELEEL|nr:caveolin-2 [Electrophorus electricus]
MMSDEYLVECKIDDDENEDDEEMKNIHSCPTPPTQFTSASQNSLIYAESRDPFGVNSHLKVDFSDVLAEPASTHSYDRVWVYSGIGFEAVRIWSYRCLTTLCAVPVSCLSGCLFALLAFLHIWCVIPCVQVCHTCLPCVRSLWTSAVNIFIVPLCTSVARCCSGIYILLSQD